MNAAIVSPIARAGRKIDGQEDEAIDPVRAPGGAPGKPWSASADPNAREIQWRRS
jgi:hypothetical protein